MSSENVATEATAWESQVAGSLAAVTQLAVEQSLRQAQVSFECFRKEVELRVNEVLQSKAVLHIKLGDAESIKLTSRVSPILPRLVTNAKLGLYTLLVGPAGCGKTTAAHQLSEALKLQFGSVCLTAGASETWLFGRQTPTGFVEGNFSKLYREGGVFLADEMDAADANLLLSINTALSHNMMLNPMNGETIKKHDDFIFLGAANTNGKGSTHLYTGRSRLDAATLDRMVIVKVDYDETLENELCPDTDMQKFLRETRSNLRKEGYDEFISTRAFVFCYKQLQAGLPTKDIKESLTANWGEAAQKLAEKIFLNSFPTKQRQAGKVPKGAKSFDEKFYAKYVLELDEYAKIKPPVWK